MPPLNGVALEDSSLPASTGQWGMWVDGPFPGHLASWKVGHSETLGPFRKGDKGLTQGWAIPDCNLY